MEPLSFDAAGLQLTSKPQVILTRTSAPPAMTPRGVATGPIPAPVSLSQTGVIVQSGLPGGDAAPDKPARVLKPFNVPMLPENPTPTPAETLKSLEEREDAAEPAIAKTAETEPIDAPVPNEAAAPQTGPIPAMPLPDAPPPRESGASFPG